MLRFGTQQTFNRWHMARPWLPMSPRCIRWLPERFQGREDGPLLPQQQANRNREDPKERPRGLKSRPRNPMMLSRGSPKSPRNAEHIKSARGRKKPERPQMTAGLAPNGFPIRSKRPKMASRQRKDSYESLRMAKYRPEYPLDNHTRALWQNRRPRSPPKPSNIPSNS